MIDNREQDEDHDRAKHVYKMPFGPALLHALWHIAADRRLGWHFGSLQLDLKPRIGSQEASVCS
jgi:hypothetical protein